MRAVIYARYSSDLQLRGVDRRPAGGVRVCQGAGLDGGGQLHGRGARRRSRFRPGFQKLTADAGQRRFGVVICEAVDRLVRRLGEDTADLQDTLAFHKGRRFTPSLVR